MKKIILFLLKSKMASRLLLKPILVLHSYLYSLISVLVVETNDGIHPKHGIIFYEKWFLDSISDTDIVLDIGCNDGTLSRFLSRKAKNVIGIEIVEKHIMNARKKTKESNVTYFLGDATIFDYNQIGPISVIVLSNVLEHLNDRPLFLKKVISIVKWIESPRILIRIPTLERDWLAVYKKELGIKYLLDSTHCIEHTMQEFNDEISQAGLVVKSVSIKFGEIYADCTVA